MKTNNPAAQLAHRRWAGVSAKERSRIMSEARKHGGGRPKKIVECKRGCGASGGVAEMRKHRCPTRPKS
jgi:hypothetical protein